MDPLYSSHFCVSVPGSWCSHFGVSVLKYLVILCVCPYLCFCPRFLLLLLLHAAAAAAAACCLLLQSSLRRELLLLLLLLISTFISSHLCRILLQIMSEKATKPNASGGCNFSPSLCSIHPTNTSQFTQGQTNCTLNSHRAKPIAPSPFSITHPTPELPPHNSDKIPPSEPLSSTANSSTVKSPIADSAEKPLSPKKTSAAPQQTATPPRAENVAALSAVTPSQNMQSLQIHTPPPNSAARVAGTWAQVS
jgi:hypothetical protein